MDRAFAMMTVRRILSAFLMLACVSAFGDNGSAVMLWFVDNPQITVNGGGQIGITDLPGWSADEDANELAARVHAVDGDGTSVYLDLWYYDDASGKYLKDLEVKEAWVNEKGQVGVGYSPIPGALDPTTAQFIVELGRLAWDEDEQGLLWQITLAVSSSATYADLVASGHISPGELAIPDHTPWSDFAFVVPEPSSGLLVLLGGAFCVLRRRRRCVVDAEGVDVNGTV